VTIAVVVVKRTHPLALRTSREAKRDGKMRLPGPRIADQEDVLPFADVFAAGNQLPHQL
jgi:hypothetical protein